MKFSKLLITKQFKLTDIQVMLVFLTLGPLPCLFFAIENGYIFFFQNFTPESVMWACGYGFQNPREILEPLSQFLLDT